MVLFRQLFSNTPDAVFAIDKNRRISFWNHSCESLFGIKSEEAINHPCGEILCGHDLTGHKVCNEQCVYPPKLMNGGNNQDFDLVIKGMDGHDVWVNVSTYVVPVSVRNETEDLAFFGLRRVNCNRLIQRLVSESSSQECLSDDIGLSITSREKEILALASKGFDTQRIAESLSISAVTVRNHFKNSYAKLDVHSRAEAVSKVLRYNII